MATVPVASHKAFLGIAKETTKGTAVASTFFIPFDLGTLKYTPGQMLLEDKGARGTPADVYNMVAGVNYSEVGWSGNVYGDGIGFLLAGVFGQAATTGTGPYVTTFSVLTSGDQQPKSYTVNAFIADVNKQIAGVQFSELTFSWTADGALTYTVKGVGMPAAGASAPTPSFGTVPLLSGWHMTATIGGSVSADVLGGEVSIKRTVTRVHTSSASSGAPGAIWASTLAVDGKLSLVMESYAEVARLTTPATTSIDLNFAGASASLELTAATVQYTAAEPDLGKEWVELPVSFRALHNSTTDVGFSGGYGPARAILTNNIVGNTYL